MYKKYKKIIDNTIIILLFYCGFLAFLYFNQRNMMYFPGDARPTAEVLGIDAPEIVVIEPQPGLKIEGWYWPPKAPQQDVVLYFHGNAQDYPHWMAKISALREAGYGALLAEYRGYGGNPGAPTEDGLLADAQGYVSYLNNNLNIKSENIVLYGESLGTGVAVSVASTHPVKAVILESAYTSTADIAADLYFLFPVRLLMKDQFRSIERIAGVKSPILFIHASNDRTIPIYHARKLYEAAPGSKRFMEIGQGGHNEIFLYGGMNHALLFLHDLENSGQL